MASKKTQERLAKVVAAKKAAEPESREPVQTEPEESGTGAQPEPKREEETKRDERRVSKEALVEIRQELLSQARRAGLEIGETSGVYRVAGKGKLWLSIAKSGATVNLLGFCVDGATPVTEEEAKARHIGRTRGQLSMSAERSAVLAVFARALAALQVAGALALFIR